MKVKNIIICVCVALLLIVGTFLITKSIYNKKVDVAYSKLKAGEISELKKYSGEIPNFSIRLRGLYTGSFSDEDLKNSNIEVYEFDGCVKYTWGTVEHTYIGFKFKDLLAYKDINNYDRIEFIDINDLSVNYNKDDITDNSFIIIARNGGPIVEQFVGFLDFNYYYNYSVESLLTVVFK